MKEARFRAAENEKEQTKTEHTLAAIEQAALQAYQKDLAVEFGEAEAKKASIKMIALREKYGGEVDIGGRPAAAQQEEQDTSKIKDEIQANVQRKLEELQRQKQAAAAQEAAAQCPWQLYYSPEGYPYYYNTTTGGIYVYCYLISLCVFPFFISSPLHSLTIESQWEVPPGYQPQPHSSSVEASVQETATDAQKQTTTESNQDNTLDSSNEQKTTKRSVEETELEPRESHQPSKRRAGPYGAWSTVAVYERTEEETPKESQEAVEEEADSSEEDEEREDKLKFEEKTVGNLDRSEGERPPPTAVVAGAFKGFGFKKRAGNRPQIRQLRTNDL